MNMFKPRRPAEPKGRGGKTMVGIWATREEHAVIRRLAQDRGHRYTSDYLRQLIHDDIEANGAPDGDT